MPRGRMLNKVISTSEKLSKVSVHSALLYTWMIPHLDQKGKIFGNSSQIKGIVVPYREDFTIKKIEKCLSELHECGLILIYGNGCKYILLNRFDEHQNINETKEAPSVIPDPTPEELQSLSSETLLKVKVSKDKVKDKVKDEIPTLEDFLAYCKTLKIYHSGLDFQLEAKYNAWVGNGWKDGNDNKIKNWKTKIQNTIPYFKNVQINKGNTGYQSKLAEEGRGNTGRKFNYITSRPGDFESGSEKPSQKI